VAYIRVHRKELSEKVSWYACVIQLGSSATCDPHDNGRITMVWVDDLIVG